MRFLDAINSIEKCVKALGIKHKDGTPMEPEVAIGKVGKFCGPRYDDVIDRLYDGKVTVDEYYLEMIKLIAEYRSRERTD